MKPMDKYNDMMKCPRPVSCRRASMSRADRAAQFAPFAALTGFDGVIDETGRLTDGLVELTEEEMYLLNGQLQQIYDNIHRQQPVAVTYFQPDRNKKGGAYISTEGIVKKIDLYTREVCMEDGTRIPIDRIFRICPVDDGEKMP